MKGKNGALGPAILIGGIILLAIFAGPTIIDTVKGIFGGDDKPETLTIEKDGKEVVVIDPDEEIMEKELKSCGGSLQAVNGLFDDINYFNVGVDPSSTLTLRSKNGEFYKKTIADDASDTTIPVLSSFEGLAGNNLGTPVSGYFAEDVAFETECVAEDIQTNLYKAAAPSMIITNDNGKTLNSDTNHESMSASNTYTPCVTVKAPSQNCSARYGAIVSVEYDASFIQKVDRSKGLTTSMPGIDSSFLVPHSTNLTPTMAYDQYRVMFWNGAGSDVDGDGNKDVGFLCNGDDVEICFDLTTTSSDPGEDEGNFIVHWYPINKDLNARTLDPIKGIYDEDNNVISQGNNTVVGYSA